MNFFVFQKFVQLLKASNLPKIKPIKRTSLSFSYDHSKHVVATFAFVFLLLNSITGLGQVSEEWVARYNGSGNENDYPYSVVVDNEGNVYVIGRSMEDGTKQDYATVKYNASGEEQWVARYNGSANEYDFPMSLAVDAEGNVYVTGGSVGDGTKQDYATVKYNASGEEQWVARYNGIAYSNDFARSIAVDEEGNVYVTGESWGRDNIEMEYVTVKYNASGEEQWVANYNGSENGYAPYKRITSLAIDAEGNVYVSGQSNGETGHDIAIVKYNASGEEQWVTKYNGSASKNERPHFLAVDLEGNVYVTGPSEENETNVDYATVKYNTSGEEQWVKKYNGPGNKLHYEDEPRSLTVDSEGNVYVTGRSWGSDTTEYDYATVKYNVSGEEQWVARYDGPDNMSDGAHSVTVDAEGNVYVIGESHSEESYYDIVTVKYNASGEEQWVARYNGPDNGGDNGISIALDRVGNVFVTGGSQSEEAGTDIATIKYTQDSNSDPDLAAPSELVAEGVSSSQINLSWQDNSEDEENFVLERATNPQFTGSVADISIPANRTSYEDPYKTTDVTFYYRIKAVKGDVSSEYSSTVSAVATEMLSNQPPVVDAGEDKSLRLPENSTSFTAQASDPDGEISSYLWEQVKGPATSMSGETTHTLSLSELVEGSYTFEVTVTDDEGATASDQVNLRVDPESTGNIAPVADAGADQTVTAGSDGTASVTLDGSGSSDPDGSINRYEWARDSVEFTKGIQPTVSLPVGTHTITLTVYDNEWITDTDEVLITVNDATAFAAPSNLSARGVSGDQINLSWQDNSEDEEGFVLERATNSNFTGSVAYINLPAGRTSYEDKRKAADVLFYYRIKAVKENTSSPYSNIASAEASYSGTNQPPVANAGTDQTLTAGGEGTASLTLDGSGSSDADGSIVSYSWAVGGEEIATGEKPAINLTIGTHTIILTVTDNERATDTDEVVIMVNETPTTFAAPSALAAKGVSSSQINLSWQDNTEDEEGFVLERATNPDFTGSVAYISIPANRTSYEDPFKTTDVTFYYRIKAIKADVSSPYSNIASAAASSSAGASMRVAGKDDQNPEMLMEGVLNAYPNPFLEELTLELRNDYEGEVQLVLYDLTGRKFLEETVEKSSREHVEKLQLSDSQLPRGLYFLKLYGEGMGERVFKLVKE